MDGQQIETQTVNVAPNASASVSFPPVTLAEAGVHGVVRAGTDALPADNAFHFVLSPSQAVSVLVVDSGTADSPSSLSVEGARHRHDAGIS